MKGNRTNHETIKGDKELGDRLRAYLATRHNFSNSEIAVEMGFKCGTDKWGYPKGKTTLQSWRSGRSNPRGDSIPFVLDYLRRMKWP